MKCRGLMTALGNICLILLLAAPTMAQVIKVRFTDHNPLSAWGSVHAVQPWVKKVEEVTGGKVKIDIYPSQTLAKGVDAWNAVKSGVADMCWCFHGFWPDMTPLADVITLPFLPTKTAEKGSEVLWKLYEKHPEIQREFKDVHVLLFCASDPYYLITAKKQVKTLEDIKGMKIRVPGGPPTEMIKALGAVPLLFPPPDIYQSLQRGVIDGTALASQAIEAFRLFEVVKYYTVVPLFTTYFSVSMNKQKWESLPNDTQKAITAFSGLEGSKFWGHNFFDTADESIEEVIKKGGYEMIKYTLPPEELERWTKVAGVPIWKAWVKKLEEKGRPEAQKILNSTLEMVGAIRMLNNP